MDMFKCFTGEEVDLDDPCTYGMNDQWWGSSMDLYYWTWAELGRSLFYMQFFHPDIDWGDQEKRVHEYCQRFAAECKEHLEDTEENRMWFRKFLFKFMDEVENQC